VIRAVVHAGELARDASRAKERAMRRFQVIASQPGASDRRYRRAWAVNLEALSAAFAADRRHSRWYRAHLRAARR